MNRDTPRVGLGNLVALFALAGWGWYAAAAAPDLALTGPGLGSLVSGLAVQGLWFVPVGLLVPLVLPRMFGVVSGFFFVLLPGAVLGAVVTVLIMGAPADAPWRVFQEFAAPELLSLLGPLAGMFAGVLVGAMLARGLRAALVVLPAVVAIGAVLLAIVSVALLLLSDRVATVEPIAPAPASEYRSVFGALLLSGATGSPLILDEPALSRTLRVALTAAGVEPGLRLGVVPSEDALLLSLSLPAQLPLLGERYFNIAAASEPTIEDGVFRARLRSLEIGKLSLPKPWVRVASRVFSRRLRRSSLGGWVVSRLDGMAVEDSRLVIGAAPPSSSEVASLEDAAVAKEVDTGK